MPVSATVFHHLCGLSGVIRAIDGYHIRAQRPQIRNSFYFIFLLQGMINDRGAIRWPFFWTTRQGSWCQDVEDLQLLHNTAGEDGWVQLAARPCLHWTGLPICRGRPAAELQAQPFESSGWASLLRCLRDLQNTRDWCCGKDHNGSLFSIQYGQCCFRDMSGTPTWLPKAGRWNWVNYPVC